LESPSRERGPPETGFHPAPAAWYRSGCHQCCLLGDESLLADGIGMIQLSCSWQPHSGGPALPV
jgi:hypothetical protein